MTTIRSKRVLLFALTAEMVLLMACGPAGNRAGLSWRNSSVNRFEHKVIEVMMGTPTLVSTPTPTPTPTAAAAAATSIGTAATPTPTAAPFAGKIALGFDHPPFATGTRTSAGRARGSSAAC